MTLEECMCVIDMMEKISRGVIFLEGKEENKDEILV